ncbi:MAG: alpha/beta fold hydrolase [Desulfobacterales bacterium]|jgi:3-oxoadipate enol-lactonase|nr:alpha/beta fold hydrolase [Desulfobacteraceae bacterium]MBT7085094.1 alpha/beta fold hydrolase [Desulfobacterales bacterium]MBT7697735.1 alpha/beta fold hydrolase [Desulfobacterales bacterium]
MPFAATKDNIHLYYETIGEGEPLLLVMGQGSDHRGWDGVRDDFASKFQVIVYDHRGTGQSDMPEHPPYSTQSFAQDAVAILDHLGIQRAHAYGISMGGRVCQWLGLDHPDRIGSLVLGCTTPGNLHGVKRPPEVDDALSSADFVRMMDTLVSSEWLASNPEFLENMAEMAKNPIPQYAQQLHYLASEGHEAWDLLPAITAPTLVIHGSDDQVNMTANAQLLADQIPGAELYIVEGGRHIFFEEFREESSRVVNDFLARHPLS